MWEGDREFLKIILETKKIFSAKFKYDGDKLEESNIITY